MCLYGRKDAGMLSCIKRITLPRQILSIGKKYTNASRNFLTKGLNIAKIHFFKKNTFCIDITKIADIISAQFLFEGKYRGIYGYKENSPSM